jgi:2-polyprenyl-6-methoxyphenol hydroxylase-like FAD-dependent oxidoreductase
MIDFFGPGYDAAEAMGLLPRIRQLGYHVQELTYHDETGRRRAGMRFDQFAKIVDGRLVSIMRPDLERALREPVSGGIDLRFGTGPVGIEQRREGVAVTLTGGGVLDADLLVGCDGIHSTVRRLIFGPERNYLRYLGFHTGAFLFADPAVHAEVDGRFCLTDTVNREMGFYGLRDGRVAVFAVHRTPDPTLPIDARDTLRREYASLGWIVPRALAACPPPDQVYYDQVAQIEMPAWSRGRVAVLGDACYAVSLLAGQGASLAVGGAYVLAEHLGRTRSIEGALAGYERTLRPVVAEKQRVARRGARWFLPATRRQLRIRRIALKLGRLPLLNRYLAAALVGKSTGLITELHASRPEEAATAA